MKYIPFALLAGLFFGLWLLLSKSREHPVVLSAIWKARLLQHCAEQRKYGHTYGTRSVK